MRLRSKLITTLFVCLSLTFPIMGQTAALMAAESGVISGIVAGADGKPLVGVEVQVIDINKGNILASTKTAKDGSFSFKGLEVGKSYKVKTFYGKDGDSAILTASSAPAKPATLKLAKTKGFITLVGNPGTAGVAGKGFPVWGYFLIGVGTVGAGVGGAAAAGAFDDDDDHPSPSTP